MYLRSALSAHTRWVAPSYSTHTHTHTHHTHTHTTHTHTHTTHTHTHTHTHSMFTLYDYFLPKEGKKAEDCEVQLLLWQYHKRISSYFNTFLDRIQHPSAIWRSSRSRLHRKALRGDRARLPVRLRPIISNHTLYWIFMKFSINIQGQAS